LVSPVHDIKKQAMVPTFRSYGPKDAKVRGKRDFARAIPGSQSQIGYQGVAWVIGVDRKVDGAVYLFVGAYFAKMVTLGEGDSGLDLQRG
jgi:hypothetical protein